MKCSLRNLSLNGNNLIKVTQPLKFEIFSHWYGCKIENRYWEQFVSKVCETIFCPKCILNFEQDILLVEQKSAKKLLAFAKRWTRKA